MYRSIKSEADRAALQTDLQSIVDWSTCWQLNINSKKSQVLTIPKKSYDGSYSINDIPLESLNSVRDLGFTVQHNLKSNEHCARISLKAFSVLRSIRLCFINHKVSFYLTLYTTYVRPIVESILLCTFLLQ